MDLRYTEEWEDVISYFYTLHWLIIPDNDYSGDFISFNTEPWQIWEQILGTVVDHCSRGLGHSTSEAIGYCILWSTEVPPNTRFKVLWEGSSTRGCGGCNPLEVLPWNSKWDPLIPSLLRKSKVYVEWGPASKILNIMDS